MTPEAARADQELMASWPYHGWPRELQEKYPGPVPERHAEAAVDEIPDLGPACYDPDPADPPWRHAAGFGHEAEPEAEP